MNKLIHEQIKLKIKAWLCTNITSSVGNGINFVILKDISLEVPMGAFK